MLYFVLLHFWFWPKVFVNVLRFPELIRYVNLCVGVDVFVNGIFVCSEEMVCPQFIELSETIL